MTGGASTSPCSETFKGRAPADAPEIAGAKAQVDQLSSGRGIRFYIDFHSYGQYILWREYPPCFTFPYKTTDKAI